LLTTKKQ
jgi:hypothetical protein